MKSLLILFWGIHFAGAADLGKASIINGFDGFEGAPKILQISVLDSKGAQDLFKKFKADESIPYGYTKEGCFARSTAMARLAESEDIVVGKIFIEGELRVHVKNKWKPYVSYAWHIAPVVFVKNPQGKLEMAIFDPSLFDEPVDLNRLQERLLDKTDGYKPTIDRVYFGSRFQHRPLVESEVYKSEWNAQDLEETQTMNRDHLIILNAKPYFTPPATNSTGSR